MINREDHWSWSNYKHTRRCKERNLDRSAVIQHLNQTRKLKKLDQWVLHELTGKKKKSSFWSAQFSSVAQSCSTSCNPMDCIPPGFPVHHQLLESTQTHVHWVNDAIQPSHPLSSPSPPTFNLPQHQGLFQWVSSSHQVATVSELQLWHQSFQWRVVLSYSILCPWGSPGKNTRMGCHFPLQGIFPTQESNWGLLYCRQILHWLGYEGSLFYSTTMNYFLIGLWLWRQVVCMWQPAMPSSVAGPRRSSKAQAKLAPQRSRPPSGGLLPVWPTTAFWTLAKPLHLRGKLGKSMRCTQRNTCSRHWSEWAPLSPVQGGRRASWMGRDCYVHTSFSFSSASAPLGFNLACFVIPLYLFYWRIIRLVKK